MPSRTPDWHQAAIVDTFTLSNSAATFDGQRPSARQPSAHAAGPSGQPLGIEYVYLNLFYNILREVTSGAGAESLLIEDLGDPAVGGIGRQGTQPSQRRRGRSAVHRRSARGEGCSARCRLPSASGSTPRSSSQPDVRQTSLIKNPSNCLRSTCVVVGGLPQRRQVLRQRQDPRHAPRDPPGGPTARAVRPIPAPDAPPRPASPPNPAPDVRATRRFSGSTARNRRRANSAS